MYIHNKKWENNLAGSKTWFSSSSKGFLCENNFIDKEVDMVPLKREKVESQRICVHPKREHIHYLPCHLSTVKKHKMFAII